MSKTIHAREEQFLNNGKLLSFGAYDDLIINTSTSHWDKQGLLINRRRSQRKAWVFCGAYTEDLMIGMAVVDAGYAANAFAYFYVPSEDIFVEDKVILPLGFSNSFDPSLDDTWQLKNFKIHTEGDQLICNLNSKFKLSLTTEMNTNGLSFICPSKDRPFNFTYKNLCLPIKAVVEFRGKTYALNGDSCSIDFSKGFPPRSTFWNWASVIGKTSDSKNVGMNLFRGHNGKYENAAWIDGHRILLSNTTFTYDDNIPLDQQDCLLQTEDGLVDLKFIPSGKRSEKINAGMISHDFVQAFGRFEGTVNHRGEQIHLVGYGPLEKHFSKW